MIQSASGRIGLVKRYLYVSGSCQKLPRIWLAKRFVHSPTILCLNYRRISGWCEPIMVSQRGHFTRSPPDARKSIHPWGRSGVKTELKAFLYLFLYYSIPTVKHRSNSDTATFKQFSASKFQPFGVRFEV